MSRNPIISKICCINILVTLSGAITLGIGMSKDDSTLKIVGISQLSCSACCWLGLLVKYLMFNRDATHKENEEPILPVPPRMDFAYTQKFPWMQTQYHSINAEPMVEDMVLEKVTLQ